MTLDFSKSLKLILLVSFVVIAAVFCPKKTAGFTLLGISSKRAYNPDWEIRSLTILEKKEVEDALSQSYHYLAQGSQSFVFSSQDCQYVIKFFKQRLFKPSHLLNSVPLPTILHRFRAKRNWKRADKLVRDFASYKYAFEELHDETKVVYVHLNSTTSLKKKLQITDKIGIHHTIDLDTTNFIVQKRAEPVFVRIHTLMMQGKVEEAKQNIGQILRLHTARAEKGFRDRDPDVLSNCGFIGAHAIKLDVGRFEKNDALKKPEIYRQEIKKIMVPFKSWIKCAHPALLECFDEAGY